MSGIEVISSADEIVKEIKSSPDKIKKMYCSFFNGGSTVQNLLSDIADKLDDDFEIRFLLWEAQCTKIPPGDTAELEAIAAELQRLHRFLDSQQIYRSDLRYTHISELVCEYLMLASDILKAPGRHLDLIQHAKQSIKEFAPAILRKKKLGSIIARRTPYYMPGRIIIVDDRAFVSLYLYNGDVNTTIAVDQGNPLYARLDTHFSDTWKAATGRIVPGYGPKAADEAKYWREKTFAVPTVPGKKIFISYIRNDMPWAVARVYDRLMGEFSCEGVFLDQEIPAGVQFPARLEEAIRDCAVVMVVIGREWLNTIASRAPDRPDWVRFEITKAIEQGKTIIPILLDDVQMPASADLPDDIKILATTHSMRVRCVDFLGDMNAVVSALERRIR
jgi:hypothetical protein